MPRHIKELYTLLDTYHGQPQMRLTHSKPFTKNAYQQHILYILIQNTINCRVQNFDRYNATSVCPKSVSDSEPTDAVPVVKEKVLESSDAGSG
jgi:hypothetical protein